MECDPSFERRKGPQEKDILLILLFFEELPLFEWFSMSMDEMKVMIVIVK